MIKKFSQSETTSGFVRYAEFLFLLDSRLRGNDGDHAG
jgi:hypothetical protein